MRRLLTTLILAVLAALGGVAYGQSDDPRTWLNEMNEAFVELSYDGVFSYFSGQDLASLRVVHMVVDGEQRERLVHLNGAPREIIRRGDDVDCILMPGDAILELGDNIPSGPFARAFVRRYDNISDHYQIAFYGEDRVAGRMAARVAVTPLDENRFGYRLWLDKSTRLLLRSELIDQDGSRLEIFQFSTLVLGNDVGPDGLEPIGQHGSIVHQLKLDTQPTVPVANPDVRWRATWLPAGFTMATADIRLTPTTQKSINTMMFSDGLAAFSIFIEDMPPAGAASMVSRTGATVAVTHLTSGPEQRNHLITLVGELPTATARRIAESIRFTTGP